MYDVDSRRPEFKFWISFVLTDYFSEFIFHSTLVFSSVQKETGNGLLIWQGFNEIIDNTSKVSSVVQNKWLRHYFHYQYFERDYICVIVLPLFSFFKKAFFLSFVLLQGLRKKPVSLTFPVHYLWLTAAVWKLLCISFLKIYT